MIEKVVIKAGYVLVDIIEPVVEEDKTEFLTDGEKLDQAGFEELDSRESTGLLYGKIIQTMSTEWENGQTIFFDEFAGYRINLHELDAKYEDEEYRMVSSDDVLGVVV